MSKKQIKRIIFMGLGCAALLIAAVIYSLLYNEGRWVKEMDMSTYVFTPKDIPMLAVGVLIVAYAVYILVLCIRNAFSKKYPDKKIFQDNLASVGILRDLRIFRIWGLLDLR